MRRGLFIAILGPDGVGKSTLADHLVDLSQDLFPAVRRQHVRPRLFGRRDAPNAKPHGGAPPSRMRALLKLAYLSADYLLGYLLITRPALARGALCISDRYFHELLVDPVRHRCDGTAGIAQRIAFLIPRPDVVFVLDADSAAVLARKSELPEEELERQLAAFRALAASDPTARVLDATQPATTVAAQARQWIATHMRAPV